MRALIIEQEALIACTIEDALRDIGFTAFDFACSVEDAVAAAERSCPDLITSDIRLGAGTSIDDPGDLRRQDDSGCIRHRDRLGGEGTRFGRCRSAKAVPAGRSQGSGRGRKGQRRLNSK